MRLPALLAILIISLLGWISLSQIPLTTNTNLQTGAIKASVVPVAKIPIYSGEEIKAPIYLVKPVGEDKPWLKRLEWKRTSVASLTKIATVLLALEEISPFDRLVLSEDAKKQGEKTSPLKVGESLSRDDWIKLALIGSANDAAYLLADEIGRVRGGNSFEKRLKIFTDLAHEKFLSIGLKDSSFINPAGFDAPDHYSTAKDLAELGEYILEKYPELWDISKMPETEVYSKEGVRYVMLNTNPLVKQFPAIIGSKTGFTDKAQGTLMMLYPLKPSGVAIIVILGSPDREGDGKKIIEWIEQLNIEF